MPESGGVEIDEQSDLEAGQLQIGEDLRLVDAQQALGRFKLWRSARHSLYAPSSNPGPSARCTLTAAASLRFVRSP